MATGDVWRRQTGTIPMIFWAIFWVTVLYYVIAFLENYHSLDD